MQGVEESNGKAKAPTKAKAATKAATEILTLRVRMTTLGGQNDGPLIGSIWIGFREVNARTEPVIGIFASLKRLVVEKFLACILIAAVVSQNERRGKTMHPAVDADRHPPHQEGVFQPQPNRRVLFPAMK